MSDVRASLFATRPDVTAPFISDSDSLKVAKCAESAIHSLHKRLPYSGRLPIVEEEEDPDAERACDDAVSAVPHPWSEPVLRILLLDRASHSCVDDAETRSTKGWAHVLSSVLDGMREARRRASDEEARIADLASKLREYAETRSLDKALDVDREHVLDQHRIVSQRLGLPVAKTAQEAADQCSSCADVPETHSRNVQSLRQRELTQAFARERLREMIHSLAEEHVSGLDRGESIAEKAYAQLPHMHEAHREQMARSQMKAKDMTQERQACFSKLVTDQFTAEEEARTKLNRALQLLNAARAHRQASLRRRVFAQVQPLLVRSTEQCPASD